MAVGISEIEVDVDLVLDLPAVERASQGREPGAFSTPGHVVELGVRGLCSEGEVSGEHEQHYYTKTISVW